ncbi:MAG: hypothetical protein ACLR6B_09985 [Blautia sp.]
MLGKEFLISWPEFEVRRADETDTQYAAILEECRRRSWRSA